MSDIDQIALWVGRVVLGTGAALAASSLVAGISLAAFMIGSHHLRRLGNIGVNLTYAHQWVRAGRPKVESTDGFVGQPEDGK